MWKAGTRGLHTATRLQATISMTKGKGPFLTLEHVRNTSRSQKRPICPTDDGVIVRTTRTCASAMA